MQIHDNRFKGVMLTWARYFSLLLLAGVRAGLEFKVEGGEALKKLNTLHKVLPFLFDKIEITQKIYSFPNSLQTVTAAQH